LFAKGAISKSELDRTMTQCSSAAQHVGAARARTAIYAKGISDGIVRAPFDGIVSERGVQIGEWVAPGRALFTLVDSDPLRVELSVPESSVPSITLGQPVSISTVARPGVTYPASITRMAAEIGRTRSLIVEATITNHRDQLVPGMFVEAQVITGSIDRPIVPEAAVARRGKTWHAFVIKGDTLEDRIVQLGPVPGPGQRSILQNLAPGERVAARVTDQIIDGLRVAK
jgi:membrane fusion protein (multidrug efflux system)